MPAGESLRLYSDWRSGGRPAELHVYAKGLPIDHGIERFGDWLSAQGHLKHAP